MWLDDLLDDPDCEAVTPVTPCNPVKVTENSLQNNVVTPVTPVTPQNINVEENDQQALSAACRAACEGVPGITPEQFESLLNADDRREILAGLIPAIPTLRAYAESFARGIRSGRIALLRGEDEA